MYKSFHKHLRNQTYTESKANNMKQYKDLFMKHVIARVFSTLIDEYDDEPLPSGPTRLMFMIPNDFC